VLNPGKKLAGLVPKNWSLIFILFLAILGTYYASLPSPFMNLDDPQYIRDDPYIRDLSWGGIYKIFSRPIVHNYFPLQILSYTLDYQIWHLQPFGYRLHNVVLHVLNAVLVFLLLKKIFSNIWVSFLAGLFFGLHPVNVESVTWIAERKNVLSMAFLLLSLLAYLYYLEALKPGRKKGFYAAALLFFPFALLAKVSAVVLPALLFLYDLCFLRRSMREMVRDKLPFLALAFLFSVIAVWMYRQEGVLANYYGGSPYPTFLAMINVFVEYIIYLIVPVYLDHLYWTPIPQTILGRQVLLSLAVIFLLALLAWRSFRRDRVFFFCLGWFFISLLPVLNIVPLVILRADRYMYLPAIGFFYLLSWGLWKISQRGYKSIRFPLFLLCSLLVAGTYSFLTMERNKLWKDPMLFWEENLRKFPQSKWAYRHIGHIYIDRGKYDQAISFFQLRLREDPQDVILLNGLAISYKHKNELRKAEDVLAQAIRLDPKDGDAYNNLGAVYYQEGKMERARFYLQKALEVNPNHAAARDNLGAVFYSRNQLDEAIREFEKARELSPCSIEPYLNLAMAYKKKGMPDKTESYLRKGLDYVPESHPALLELGRILFEQGKIQEARDYLNRAYRIKPTDRDTRYFLQRIAQVETATSSEKAKGTTPPSPPKAMESPMEKHPGRGML
jgi:type IV pilus biogenesis/stability protein PilW